MDFITGYAAPVAEASSGSQSLNFENVSRLVPLRNTLALDMNDFSANLLFN